MSNVRQILEALEEIAPKRFAFAFDKVGLQVGSTEATVERAVVSLDRSLGAVAYAKEHAAQFLLAHHPLIFRPIETVDAKTHVGRTILELIKNDIAFVAAHTNWDSARGGINDTLVEMLGLTDISDFGTAAEVKRFKLVTTCPPGDVDRVIDAASEAGAGVIGSYSRCAFISPGRGSFVSGHDANPTIGSPGEHSSADEVRIEMIVSGSAANAAVRAIKSVHPYEEPIADFYMLRDVAEQPAARAGLLPQPMSLRELAAYVDERFQTRCWTWGKADKKIRKVAVCGGAADEEWMHAQRAGADVLVTGEVKQHVAVEAGESGMCIIAAGHYQTEHPGCASLRDRMARAVPDVDWLLFEPEPGLSGRPF